MYIRSSISAQSLASVPPSRALIVRIAPLESKGPLSSPLSSSCSTSFSSRSTSPTTSLSSDESSSAISTSVSKSSDGGNRLVERLEQSRPAPSARRSWLALLPGCPRSRARPSSASMAVSLRPACQRGQRESRSWTMRSWIALARSVNSLSMMASGAANWVRRVAARRRWWAIIPPGPGSEQGQNRREKAAETTPVVLYQLPCSDSFRWRRQESIERISRVNLHDVEIGGHRVAAELLAVHVVEDGCRHRRMREHFDPHPRTAGVGIFERLVPPLAETVGAVVALGPELEEFRQQDFSTAVSAITVTREISTISAMSKSTPIGLTRHGTVAEPVMRRCN